MSAPEPHAPGASDAPDAPDAAPCVQCGKALPAGFTGPSCPACLLLGAGAGATGEIDGELTVAMGVSEPGAAVPMAVIGPYRLVEPLGEGGFGTVWRAEQSEPIRREVALKLIKPGMGSREVLARFEAERRALALMEHPNIAAVLDAGTAGNGQPYFVMELVRGLPVTTFCDERCLTLRQRLELFIPVCQAVQHAHQKAVLHRDLKPSNILVAEVDGQPLVKVIDFGVAKALGQDGEESWQGTLARTLDGMVVGTPQYMSPEQAGAAPDIDTRSDIYTLGVILYELLCGETPLTRESLRQAAVDEMLRRIREEEAVRPSSRLSPISEAVRARADTRQVAPERMRRELRGDLDWIILKALEKERERRYGSAAALAADIQRHLDDEPVEAGPPSAWYRLGKLARRYRIAFIAGSTVVISLTTGIGVSSWQAVRARLAEKRAAASSHEAVEANQKNLILLSEASAADYQTALQRLEKDANWREGVALLARALRLNPNNELAAARLYDALAWRSPEDQGIPRAILKHQGEVVGAEFSSDGTKIITASKDHTAQIWNSKTGKPIGGPIRHDAGVLSANFSPDGKRAVTSSSDQTVRIWDLATGKAMKQPMRTKFDVASAKFSSDGSRIAISILGNSAEVWDVATGKILGRPIRLHGLDGTVAHLSNDGNRMLAPGPDGSARVWDVLTGNALSEPMLHNNGISMISSARFSPDGSRVVTSGADGLAHIWDAVSGKTIGEPLHHKGPISDSVFSADGTRIVTTSWDHTARTWDVATGSALSEPMSHEKKVVTAHFSEDGLRVVTASDDYTARVWDSTSGKALGQPLQHASEVRNARFSPDGTVILTVSYDNMARIWDAPTGKSAGEPLSHDVSSAEFSADGKRIVTASYGNTAQVWDAEIRESSGESLRHDDRVSDAHFSKDGSRIVTSSRDGTARVWDSTTGKPLSPPLRHEKGIWDAKFNPEASLVVTASADRCSKVWDWMTGKVIGRPMPFYGSPGGVHFSPNGKHIVIWGNGGEMQIFDVATCDHVGNPSKHEGLVLSADFSRDGTRIVTASHDKTARVWDASSGDLMGDPLRHDDSVESAEFSPDGTKIVTASWDKTARVWDAASGRLIFEPLEHEARVKSASFSANGSRIITVDWNGIVRIWDAITGCALGGTILGRSAQFSPDGSRVITLGAAQDGAARIWRSPNFSRSMGGVPAWFLAYANAACGLDYDSEGRLRTVPAEKRLDTRVNPLAGNDIWANLARWLATPPPNRKLTPDSDVTCRQVALRERDSLPLNRASIESALKYDPKIPLAHILLAEIIEEKGMLQQPNGIDSSSSKQAAWLRVYGLKMLPDDDAEIWCRAAESLFRQKDFPNCVVAIEKALSIAPGMERALKVKKSLPTSRK